MKHPIFIQNLPVGSENDCLDSLKQVDAETGSLKNEWMDSNEAAEFLRISVETLWNLTSNGLVPFYKLGRRNRYKRKDLENLLNQNKRGPHGN